MDNPRPPGVKDGAGRELALRVASAAILAPLAIGVTWLGGWPFLVFWTIAAGLILWEWRMIQREPFAAGSAISAAAIALAGYQAMQSRPAGIALGIVIAAAVEAVATREHRMWAAAGALYAATLLVSCMLLRADVALGSVAILLLFGIVWATDVGGYFVGRWVGGPKLWPAVSPKKTWSGALGGALGAIGAALAIASYAYRANLLAVAGIALLLSAVSQAGDLFESAVKRRFGVKDASHVIPGHGGVMDRLDGFLVAAAVAACIGIARGGVDAPARGLLVW